MLMLIVDTGASVRSCFSTSQQFNSHFLCGHISEQSGYATDQPLFPYLITTAYGETTVVIEREWPPSSWM